MGTVSALKKRNKSYLKSEKVSVWELNNLKWDDLKNIWPVRLNYQVNLSNLTFFALINHYVLLGMAIRWLFLPS